MSVKKQRLDESVQSRSLCSTDFSDLLATQYTFSVQLTHWAEKHLPSWFLQAVGSRVVWALWTASSILYCCAFFAEREKRIFFL